MITLFMCAFMVNKIQLIYSAQQILASTYKKKICDLFFICLSISKKLKKIMWNENRTG